MTRLKLLVLACMAAVVVSAVVSASAFATFTKTAVECGTTGVPTICLAEEVGGKLFEASGSETIANVKAETPSILEVETLALTIECKAVSAEGTISQPEPLVKAFTASKFILKFKECKITASAELAEKCEVTAEIVTKSLKGTGLTGGKLSTEPETGKVYTEITIGNKAGQTCPATVKGVNPVKGTQECFLLEPTVNKVIGLLQCEPGGALTKLEFGTNPAKFKGEAEFELASKKPFDDVES